MSYAEILKVMKLGVCLSETKNEVLSLRRTKMYKLLSLLKNGQDLSSLSRTLTTVPERKAEVSSTVSTRSLEVMDLDETIKVTEVVDKVKEILGKSDMDNPCQIFTRYSLGPLPN